MTGLYIDVVCYSVLYTIFTIHFFSNLNLSRIKRTTVEISVLILSCVILGLNPVLPVLLFLFFFFIFFFIFFIFFYFTICNLIWILPNKIHTYIQTKLRSASYTPSSPPDSIAAIVYLLDFLEQPSASFIPFRTLLLVS